LLFCLHHLRRISLRPAQGLDIVVIVRMEVDGAGVRLLDAYAVLVLLAVVALHVRLLDAIAVLRRLRLAGLLVCNSRRNKKTSTC